ncbi:MAG: hypothetical protein IKP77_04295 [Acholeplasmatales bacterium]|nr:hypothetical protein [Acholeplasmatales bacterium]
MIIINEDFNDFNTGEFPYDLGHTALGEYHHIVYPGYYGNFYDPVPLHQWRSLDGSWLITEEDGIKYLEQNRGDNTKGAFTNVYPTLTHKMRLFSSYVIDCDIRLFDLSNYCGIGFNYVTSRNNIFVGINGKEIALIKRYEERFDIIDRCDFSTDVYETHHLRIIVNNCVKVYLNDKLVLSGNIEFEFGRKIAFIAKSLCRYSNLVVSMNDNEYSEHINKSKQEEERINNKRINYSHLECIKKIHLGKNGTGRQVRIAKYESKTYLLFAQHQKRYIRDSFAHISCLSLFDTDGNLIWNIGEANNSVSNTLISCDLPFQIADINNDGRLEVIYAVNFEVIIIDLLTKKELNRIKTPIISGDPNVKDEPFYRLNVDMIRVADFEGLGYKGDIIIKDRYQNVWAIDINGNILFRYHHKNTGHFPYVFDYDNDGKDELLIGYDLVDSNGNILWSLPMNSDHTDEIIYCKLKHDMEEKFILASGNEGMNIINKDGAIYKHNEIGHAQRISIGKYDLNKDGLQIMATAFWGSDGIISLYDCNGDIINSIEMESNGSIISPVMYDGVNTLALTHAGLDGGLLDGNLDMVVKFPDDGHPDISCEVYDIDSDGIDEILCWNLEELWIYKAKKYKKPLKKYKKYPDIFSNYRGEYLISNEDI